MTPTREIEKALFDAAVVIDSPEVRRAFLDQSCQGNPDLRARLGNLVEAHAAADEFFLESEGARTVVAAEACRDLTVAGAENSDARDESDAPGTRIGRYKLRERIGAGGCGVVYLAEQQEPVRRLVALKVIRLGMDTESVIARFEMERQALAVMDHPNIARVLDAGATDNGRPYFVMEWVRGVRITEYCDKNQLDIRQRLDLFIEVCNALQHAHQKGVIHRDIKPSNILVTLHDGKPSPKVIDFGIAKATDGGFSSGTALTAIEYFVGTPAYMSPEQADRRGVDVDTRSDVYGLGILLYELLAGRTPFDSADFASAGVLETRRILTEREPVPPSAMLASLDRAELAEVADRRRIEPARLVPAVSHDLDWVVLKAIEKDRQRRYDTVHALVMDLERFLNHEPVLARPPSRFYLLGKFVKRNRLAVLAGAGITASLVLGLGLAYHSYLSEKEAREEQARLRREAEAIRASEALLLAEARIRENISQVAVLLSEGKTEEADALLQRTPLSTVRPSLEAANVLRSLGGWNAMQGRWAQASECFLMLIQANGLSSPQQIIASRDVVAAGPALAEYGNVADYQKFREWILLRFKDSTDLMAAEQILQSSLLLPADRDYLRALEPFEALLRDSLPAGFKPKRGWDTEYASWRAFALCMLEFRRENDTEALRWADAAFEFEVSKNALAAALHAVRAMILHRLEQDEPAGESLAKARDLIGAAFNPKLPPTYEPMGREHGFWWDWIQARILLGEAESMVERHSALR